jgi:hypothetical protein
MRSICLAVVPDRASRQASRSRHRSHRVAGLEPTGAATCRSIAHAHLKSLSRLSFLLSPSARGRSLGPEVEEAGAMTDPANRDGGRGGRISDVYRVGVTDSIGEDWRKAALATGARTRWLLEHAAVGLGVEPPASSDVELDWITTVFSETNALTLYVAARGLADEGHCDEALEVLGDACRAQQHGRSAAGPESGAASRSTETIEATDEVA